MFECEVVVMLKRVITGVVAFFFVFLPVVIFSETVVFPIALAFVTVISLYEMCKCMGFAKKIYISLPLYLFGAICPFMVRYPALAGNGFALIAFMFGAAYIIYLFSLVVWSHGKLAFADVMSLFITCIYIIAAISCIVYVRDYGDFGKYFYLLVFIGALITDTFAYFTGRLLGNLKLIEDVSPKKTVEGSIGGIVFCVLSFLLFGFIVEKLGEFNANYIFLGVSGVIVSIVSQIGDLIMSVIKRHYGVKDYGWILPGHGGMLDRFDSILAVSVGLGSICMFISLTGIQIL